jgi:hypothetical protein
VLNFPAAASPNSCRGCAPFLADLKAEVLRRWPGEVVGRSDIVMPGDHNSPDKTAAAEWSSPEVREGI